MIESIDITGIKYDVDDTTRKYVTKKIGRLDRYLPRHARKSVNADVRLKQINGDHGNKYEVEITLNVPDKTMTATDSTVNMLAAVDIVEAKLVAQLHKYKTVLVPHIGRRGVLSRFKRSYQREQQ
ncbi:MAG: ribosome hibernation-promoting factor, HPF/YfiA family [Candidatus Saccharimonadales bacterium]